MATAGMIWPLAQAYARRGYAVRRAGWDNALIAPNTPTPTGNQLRWITWHNALFYTAYLERGDDYIGNKVIRPTTNLDFTAADFLASDWTVQPPGCSGEPAPPNQEGFNPYPTEGSETPSLDPAFPNIAYGDCPTSGPSVPSDPTNPETPPVFPADPQPPSETDEPPGITDNPQPPMPSGGGGGGSGGGTGSGGNRRPRTKPAAAPLTVTIDPPLDNCLAGEAERTINVSVHFSLGAAPSPAADGIYWITIVCNGQVHRTNLSPLDADNHVFEVLVTPGKTQIAIQGTAYLPARRLTSRNSLVAGPIETCGADGCCLYSAADLGATYSASDLPDQVYYDGDTLVRSGSAFTSSSYEINNVIEPNQWSIVDLFSGGVATYGECLVTGTVTDDFPACLAVTDDYGSYNCTRVSPCRWESTPVYCASHGGNLSQAAVVWDSYHGEWQAGTSYGGEDCGQTASVGRKSGTQNTPVGTYTPFGGDSAVVSVSACS